MLKMKKKSNEMSLEDLAKEYRARYKKIEVFKASFAEAFRQLEALETELEAVTVKIKDAARKHVQQGRTLKLVDLPDVYVEVSGPQKALSFDVDKARKYWPKDVLTKVMAVDAALVEETIKHGEFTDELALKAALPREALTPRVTVKVTK